MTFILNIMLVYHNKRLCYINDCTDDKLRVYLNSLLDPNIFSFIATDEESGEVGIYFICLETNTSYVVDTYTLMSQTHDIFIATGYLLGYDYIGEKWNAQVDKFFITYEAVNTETGEVIKLYPEDIPITEYNEATRNIIKTKTIAFNDTLSKLFYIVKHKVSLWYYPLDRSRVIITDIIQ